MENRLKELREERGLSLRGMEIKTGIKFGTIATYEGLKRDMSTDMAKELAAFFEVSLDYLLSFNGFCLYCKYEKGNIFYKLSKTTYDKLTDYIYFNNDSRCLNLNKYFEIDKDGDASLLINEFLKVKEMDHLFKKGKITEGQLISALSNKDEITLTIDLLEYIKNAIKE